MPTFKLTPAAEEDLEQIWLHIAPDNLPAADHMIADIVGRFEMLADNPQIGASRPDIAPELRHFPVRNYLILYRITKQHVEITRVLHGRRSLPDAL